MAQRILVPLKRHDPVEDIVPYIQEVTQPGTSVVFLIHHPVDGFKWLQAYCGIAQCGLEKTLTVRSMIESYSVQMRRQLAQRRVFQTCEALRRMGAKIAVDVYTGSLRRTLRSYVNNGDAQLLVLRPGIGRWIMSFLQGVDSIGTMFRRPPASPVLLLHPGK